MFHPKASTAAASCVDAPALVCSWCCWCWRCCCWWWYLEQSLAQVDRPYLSARTWGGSCWYRLLEKARSLDIFCSLTASFKIEVLVCLLLILLLCNININVIVSYSEVHQQYDSNSTDVSWDKLPAVQYMELGIRLRISCPVYHIQPLRHWQKPWPHHWIIV